MITQKQAYNYLRSNEIKLDGTFNIKRGIYTTSLGEDVNVEFLDTDNLNNKKFKLRKRNVKILGNYDFKILVDYPIRIKRNIKIASADSLGLESVVATFIHETVHAERETSLSIKLKYFGLIPLYSIATGMMLNYVLNKVYPLELKDQNIIINGMQNTAFSILSACFYYPIYQKLEEDKVRKLTKETLNQKNGKEKRTEGQKARS